MEYIIEYLVFLLAYTLLIEGIYLVVIDPKRLYAHEFGHAKKACELQLPVLILMKNGKMSGVQNGIPCYKVTKEQFERLHNNSAGAVTIYEDRENLDCNQRLMITKAGPQAEKKWFRNWRRQLPILFLILSIPILAGIFLYPNINLQLRVILALAVPMVIHIVLYFLTLRKSAGMFPKHKIKKFKKKLEGLSEGDPLSNGVCDNAKIKYQDIFKECVKIIEDKKLVNKGSYQEVINQLIKWGYEIYSFPQKQEDQSDDKKYMPYKKNHKI